jgi:hypothetical protein
MPKVTYTAAQGLVQSAGSGISFSGNQLAGATQEVVATTVTLALADSGAVIAPSAGAAQTFTLPNVATATGFNVTFIAGSAQAHVVNGGGSKIQGVNYHNTNGTTLARAAVSNRSSLTLANPAVGDYMTIHCDGTNYYVYAWTNNALTLA